ncbi:MAG: hypothetical protein ABJL99_03025 [Aliishimia sp.]
MAAALSKALRIAAKGSGWSVKRDLLSKRQGEYVLAVHPHRGFNDCIEFRAKPIVWDRTLWSILQIEGNEAKPASFNLTGAFICDCPALVQENLADDSDTDARTIEHMVELSRRVLEIPEVWQDYDLTQASEQEQPQQLYRYHMTHVVDRICRDDYEGAANICVSALNGDLDLHQTFSSTDKLTSSGPDGRRDSQSFFDLAQLWMSRR